MTAFRWYFADVTSEMQIKFMLQEIRMKYASDIAI